MKRSKKTSIEVIKEQYSTIKKKDTLMRSLSMESGSPSKSFTLKQEKQHKIGLTQNEKFEGAICGSYTRMKLLEKLGIDMSVIKYIKQFSNVRGQISGSLQKKNPA